MYIFIEKQNKGWKKLHQIINDMSQRQNFWRFLNIFIHMFLYFPNFYFEYRLIL